MHLSSVININVQKVVISSEISVERVLVHNFTNKRIEMFGMSHMPKAILLIVVLNSSLFSQLNAQIQQLEFEKEVICVILNKGSYIIGELKNETNHDLEFVMPGGDNLFIQRKDIKKIRRTSEGYSFTKRGRFNFDKGLYCSWHPFVIFYGESYFRGNRGFTGLGTQLSVGRHHNRRLSYGLTAAYFETDNYYDRLDFGYWFTAAPIAAFINFNLNLRGPRLYCTAKLGNAFKIDRGWFKDIHSGLYGAMGLGIVFPTRSLSRFTMELENVFIKSAGLTGPRFIFEEENFVPEPFSTYAKYITLKLGVSFRQ